MYAAERMLQFVRQVCGDLLAPNTPFRPQFGDVELQHSIVFSVMRKQAIRAINRSETQLDRATGRDYERGTLAIELVIEHLRRRPEPSIGIGQLASPLRPLRGLVVEPEEQPAIPPGCFNQGEVEPFWCAVAVRIRVGDARGEFRR